MRTPKDARSREWLLVFSPGEWLWVVGTFALLGAGWWALLT